MAIGTLFTLFVVPVFYSLIAAQHVAESDVEPGADRVPSPVFVPEVALS
jgi:multidrug efflux pump